MTNLIMFGANSTLGHFFRILEPQIQFSWTVVKLPVLNLRDFLERKSSAQQKKQNWVTDGLTVTFLKILNSRRATALAKYAAKLMLGIAKKIFVG